MKKEIKSIAIDLMWLRPGKVGGTESYIRNLLDGFLQIEDDYSFVLLVSKDNSDTFGHYTNDDRFSLLEAPIGSTNIAKRIIWQNMYQSRFLKKHGLRRCFVPVYCKPWFNGGIEYICVVHDLMMIHYPKNHPLHEVLYSKLCWWMDVKNAHKIIAISNFVKEDIEKYYHKSNIEVIYNPIILKKNEVLDFEILQKKYDIEDGKYFYTISQLIPHKNLKTIVAMMDRLINSQEYVTCNLPKKLLVTGINGNASKELLSQINRLGLSDNVILSGFLDNSERNTLYQHAHSFLFPSVFEGFGMPPIEAMYYGTPVVTTRCASIPEITQGKAIYVDDPYDVTEWIKKVKNVNRCFEQPDYSEYDAKKLAKEYLSVLMECVEYRH